MQLNKWQLTLFGAGGEHERVSNVGGIVHHQADGEDDVDGGHHIDG